MLAEQDRFSEVAEKPFCGFFLFALKKTNRSAIIHFAQKNVK